jgi:hypothetical protein
MSNLKLPELTFDALKAFILKGRDKTSRTVANNTVATLGGIGQTITVRHHGSTIAILSPNQITVTNAGYGSASTRERVNGFLSSNNTGLYIGQRQGAQVLFSRPDYGQITDRFTSLTYSMASRRITILNEEAF